MKKQLLLLLSTIFICLSCSDAVDSQINGQWQLKTIEENGIASKVDTIFYSFQRGVIFSHGTLVDENTYSLSYGYVDFTTDKEFRIKMDEKNMALNFLELSGWDTNIQNFRVENIDSKNLVLSGDGKIYSFKRY